MVRRTIPTGAMTRAGWRRVVALLAVVGALAAGCGSSGAEGVAESAKGAAVADIVVGTLPVPETTEAPPPLLPWQVLVAVAKPEVTELATYDAPDGNRVTYELALTNPWYFGGELALLVEEGRETDEWLRVALPVRPNGTTAWIRRSDVDIRTHRVHIDVSLTERSLRVWDADTLLLETTVVVGTARTPTPLGRFFVNARIERANPGGVYGPWILSTSGYSEALDTFDGGLPVIAIHGTNRPGLMGSASSNGCIRVTNDVVTQLATIVPLGTPVTITA